MKIVGVVPARYKSSRFEGKPLALIYGKPMIIHVLEKVEKALGKENTFVATDDKKIANVVSSFGYKTIMTSETCKTGTDRVWEFAQQVEADIYINVQGDEPMVSPCDILKIVREKKKNINSVINGMIPLSKSEKAQNINIPKVLVNKSNELIYMSRLAIPGLKNSINIKKPKYMKQVCIYAFTFNELKVFWENVDKAEFEFFEDIEILRFLDFNIPIKMVLMDKETIAVDNPEDIRKVENALKQLNNEC